MLQHGGWPVQVACSMEGGLYRWPAAWRVACTGGLQHGGWPVQVACSMEGGLYRWPAAWRVAHKMEGGLQLSDW